MSLKYRYLQFGLLLLSIGCGCALIIGCADDAEQKQELAIDSVEDENPTEQPEVETSAGPIVAEKTPDEVNHNQPTNPGVLYDGWENPVFVLVFTGRQYGYIEPCGCTGLDRQKGGLARRHTFLQGLRERDWQVVSIDAGNQVRRFGRQPELKFNLTAELLSKMEYQAVGIGPADLKLPAGELFAVAAVNDDNHSMFISSNVAILDREFTRRFQVITTDDSSVGVASIISEKLLESFFSDDLIVESTQDALAAVVDDAEFQKTDYKVLVVHGTLDYVRDLAKENSGFDLFVCAGAPGEPAYELEEVQGSARKILKVGEKSMYASVVGFFAADHGREQLKYQRVALDASYDDSREVLAMFKQYQEELERAGFQGLGIRAEEHPSGHRFVGSQSCAQCHQEAFDIWKSSPHSHATQSLIAPHGRAEIPRQFDPECLSCHSTGWQAQQYVPYESGFMSLAETMRLEGNGCENCHGPASEHVRLESDPASAEAELDSLRQLLHRDLKEAKNSCLECHDLDNSPDFHVDGAFDDYWSRIAH